jgi:hypothetical protein
MTKLNRVLTGVVVFAFGVAAAVVAVRWRDKPLSGDINEQHRQQQAVVIRDLKKNSFDPYHPLKTPAAISNRIHEVVARDLTPDQMGALAEVMDGFFRSYSALNFDDYIAFKRAQGGGTYGVTLSTNDPDPMATWRARWEGHSEAVRQWNKMLPPTFKMRLVDFDIGGMEIDVRRMYTTNSPSERISAGTDFTGWVNFLNHSYAYDVTPETILASGEHVIWASWKFPCHTEMGTDPGYIVISAYWNDPAGAWTVHGGTSATPPTFIPIL